MLLYKLSTQTNSMPLISNMAIAVFKVPAKKYLNKAFKNFLFNTKLCILKKLRLLQIWQIVFFQKKKKNPNKVIFVLNLRILISFHWAYMNCYVHLLSRKYWYKWYKSLSISIERIGWLILSRTSTMELFFEKSY